MADGMNEYVLYALAGLACIMLLLTFWEFMYYLILGELHSAWYRRGLQVLTMVAPVCLLLSQVGEPSDCCHPALLSPDHRLSIIVLVFLCLVAFFYSSLRGRLAPPLLEVIVNCLLVAGLVTDIAVGIQAGAEEDGWLNWVFGTLPVAFHFILVMADNHRLAMESLEQGVRGSESGLVAVCRKVVFLQPWKKFPLLLVLCLPVLLVLVGVLLLFGQKPDSMIRAFTDTYHHGFSQLDYQCVDVDCGGHYLCTIAAKGHPGLVRPIRMGERGGRPIKCNRQLLVSNAFEELLEQRLPGLHRRVRRFYNRIGAGIHRHYGVFDHAWVSDTVYVLMKPLEWGFVAVLYLFDRRPEDRIARQYLRKEDRLRLDMGRCGSGECNEVQGLA